MATDPWPSNLAAGDLVERSVMKKIRAFLAVTGLSLLIAVGCGSSTSRESSSNGELSNAQSQVTVGMTKQQVEDVLGEPYAVVTQTAMGYEDIQMIYIDKDDNLRVTVWVERDAVVKVDSEPIE